MVKTAGSSNGSRCGNGIISVWFIHTGHHRGHGSNAGENGSGHKGGFRGAGGTEGILVGQ